MTTSSLTYLRILLGDAWVDKQIFGPTPTHTLGLWQKKNPDNPWIRYTEALVKSFLTSERIQFNPEILSNKLKADYVSTLAELESAAFLAQQGFVVIVKPTAPEKGPDLLAERDGVPYFVEITTVGFSEEEDRVNSASEEIFAKLRTVPASYAVHVTMGDGYTANSPELNHVIGKVVDALKLLREKDPKKRRFITQVRTSRCSISVVILTRRYPVTASQFHLIGKETERGWEQAEDVSTLLPSLIRYGVDSGIAEERLKKRLLEIPLAFLEKETGLSRQTILRVPNLVPRLLWVHSPQGTTGLVT